MFFYSTKYIYKILLLAIMSLSIRKFLSSFLTPQENSKKGILDRKIVFRSQKSLSNWIFNVLDNNSFMLINELVTGLYSQWVQLNNLVM